MNRNIQLPRSRQEQADILRELAQEANARDDRLAYRVLWSAMETILNFPEHGTIDAFNADLNYQEEQERLRRFGHNRSIRTHHNGY